MLSKLFPVFFCTEGRWTSLSIWIIKGLLLSLYRCEVCTSWLVTPGINLLLFNTGSFRLGASAVHPTPICFSIQDLNVPGYSGVMESSASFILFVYWLWKAVNMYLLTVKSRDSDAVWLEHIGLNFQIFLIVKHSASDPKTFLSCSNFPALNSSAVIAIDIC